MKKVININFQGRVIPIEEMAYETLKSYTESLKTYFANEEGRDEIISDIESRIAELFAEQLKKGIPFITDEQVQAIIQSIGRPEDFDQEEAGTTAFSSTADTSSTTEKSKRGPVYRNEADKVLGGVCSGLAHYFHLDPSIVRVLFAVIAFGSFGTGLLIYLILWLVLPSRYLQPSTRKRLYRNSDDKVIGGVASGLAAYFNISVSIPRIVFVFPLIIAVFNSIFGGPDFGRLVFSGFGGTFFLAYLILWIVIPEAKTASEKLEMRGEKVDLESIRKGVKDELSDLKGRASGLGDEFSSKVKNWGAEVKNMGSDLSQAGTRAVGNMPPIAKTAGTRLLEIIGTLFKVFFIFIAGVIVFSLFTALMALLFTGGGPAYTLKQFVISGVTQNFLLYTAVILLVVVPVIAFILWVIRRLTKTRGGSRYLGWTFAGLWTIGLVCALILGAQLSRNYRRSGSLQQDVTIVNPTTGRLQVDLTAADGKFYTMNVFDDDDDSDFPKVSANEDQILIKTVRVQVEQSSDSNYHVYLTKRAKAGTATEAEANAEKINFPIKQQDSILLLPEGFVVDKATQYRDQRVVVHIEVPIGKEISISEEVEDFSWFSTRTTSTKRGRRSNESRQDNDYGNGFDFQHGKWYRMTADGLELSDKPAEDENENNDGYRFEQKDSTNVKDTVVNVKVTAKLHKKEITGEKEPGRQIRRYSAHMISIMDLMRFGS